jgi:hypothetical protein
MKRRNVKRNHKLYLISAVVCSILLVAPIITGIGDVSAPISVKASGILTFPSDGEVTLSGHLTVCASAGSGIQADPERPLDDNCNISYINEKYQ